MYAIHRLREDRWVPQHTESAGNPMHRSPSQARSGRLTAINPVTTTTGQTGVRSTENRVAMNDVDVAIVGAGPTGLALARALAGRGLSIALIELQSRQQLAEAAFDGREIALTHASREWLTSQGLWARIPAQDVSPLLSARVMNGASPFALQFANERSDGEPLGWLVPNHAIRRAAWAAVQEQPDLRWFECDALSSAQVGTGRITLALRSGTSLSARLLVAADSRFSATRRMLGIGAHLRDHGKTMLVGRVQLQQPHHHAAWEWFGHGCTMALLPLNDDVAGAVLTLPPARAEAMLAMDTSSFGQSVTACFDRRLGSMNPLGSRHAYPLVSTYARRFIAPRSALIGDAAVGMHPVTAHGFNFGLQSVRRLAEGILQAHAAGADIGAPSLLSQYEHTHRRATRPLYEATNAIVSLYTDERRPARAMRHAALRLAARVTPFRRRIAAQLTQYNDRSMS